METNLPPKLVRIDSSRDLVSKKLVRTESFKEVNKSQISSGNTKVTIQQMGKLVNDPSKQIIISENGSIHQIGLNSLENSHDAIARDVKTKDTLLAAAKLLGNNKIKKEHIELEASASKIVALYNIEPDNKKIKKELKQGFNKAADILKNKIEKSYQDTAKIKASAKPFSRENRLGVVRAQFQDINLGKNNDGVDVHRYVHAGIINIMDNQKKVSTNGAQQGNIGNFEMEPKESLAIFVDRIEIVMRTFEEKVTANVSDEDKLKLSESISDLLDDMRKDEDDGDASATLDQTMRSWANQGNPAQKNMMKLLHTMNQEFTDGVTKPLRRMALDKSNDSPGTLLKIENIDIALEKGIKKVDYEFGENEVKVTHTFTSEVIQDKKVKSELMQKTVLTAKLDNLSEWDWSEKLSVISKDNTNNGLILAEKLHLLATDSGFNTDLIVTK
ncbi:MAG: hypothetical protein H0U49_10860 [Parachlamydiaceae bacterium]|nr:hypothetical protein [Parachlamydiaceae bacterium]